MSDGGRFREISLDKIIEAPVVRAREDAAPAEQDFADLWLILWHRRAIVATVTALSVAVVLAYCLLTPRLYTASTQILVDPRDRQVLSKGVTPDTLAADGGITQVESQVRVLQSDVVLLRAIQSAGLQRDEEFGLDRPGPLSRGVDELRAFVTGETPTPESADLRALRLLKRRLTVKRADKVFVIDVAVSAETSEKAARIAEAIAEAYLVDQTQARAAVASTASDELKAKLADLRTQVRDAENAVEQYKRTHDIVGSSGRLVREQQLTDTNNQLVSAQTRLLEARARVDTIERARANGADGAATNDALQSPNMLQLRAQYALVTRQKADLDAQLGAKHPAIASVDAQVADIRHLMAAELERIARVARTDLQQAEVTERGVRRSVEGLSRAAQATGLDYVRLRELERVVDADRAVYESYLVRSRETGEQAGINTVNARIITHAVAPIQKSWPPTLLLLLAAAGGGLALGSATALVRAHVAPVLVSRSQLRGLSDLPVIAVGPAPALLDGAAGDVATTAAGRACNHALAPLRAVLARRRGAERPAVVLLAAAAADADLKTRFARALAASVALGGARVLLVDGDFAVRRLSGQTGRSRGPGLLELLRGRRTFEEASAEDPDTGVTLLGAGIGDSVIRPLPATDLQTFAAVARGFELIVIDGGDVADDVRVGSLGSLADEHFVVTRVGSSGRALQDVSERAAAVGHPFSAIVFIHADRRL